MALKSMSSLEEALSAVIEEMLNDHVTEMDADNIHGLEESIDSIVESKLQDIEIDASNVLDLDQEIRTVLYDKGVKAEYVHGLDEVVSTTVAEQMTLAMSKYLEEDSMIIEDIKKSAEVAVLDKMSTTMKRELREVLSEFFQELLNKVLPVENQEASPLTKS